MPFIPADGIAEFVQKFNTSDSTAINVFHVQHDDLTGWSAAQLLAMGTIILNWENATGKLHRTSPVVCTGILCRDLGTQFGAETSTTGAGQGTLAGTPAPNNVTMAFKRDSGLAGRAFRGRLYWIGMAKEKCTNDTYDSAEVGAIETGLNTLLTNINATANCHHVILQSQINNVKLNPRQGARILQYTNTDITIDSQRRRLAGHNVHR